jgi:hypothetical protein
MLPKLYLRYFSIFLTILGNFGHKLPFPISSITSISQQLGRAAALCTSLSTLGALSVFQKAIADDDLPKGKLEYMPALQGLDYGKPRTFYPDFIQTKSGLQYKLVKEGTGYHIPVLLDSCCYNNFAIM